MILLDLDNFSDGAGRYSGEQKIQLAKVPKSGILVRFTVSLCLLMAFLLLSVLVIMDIF
jgi:hypothetical protein